MPEADPLDPFDTAAINPTSTLEPVDIAEPRQTRAARVGRARRARLGGAGVLAIAWLAFVTLVALLAPVLPLDDPNQNFTSIVKQPPGTDGHLLGGDGLGRDLLSRMVWGGRAS